MEKRSSKALKRMRQRAKKALKPSGLLDLPFEVVVQVLAQLDNPFRLSLLSRTVREYLHSNYFAFVHVRLLHRSTARRWTCFWFSIRAPAEWQAEFAKHVLLPIRELGVDFSSCYRLAAIPPALGQLSNLTTLRLPSLPLAGPVPPQISTLIHLKTLDLSLNYLTGTLDVFMSLTSLRVVKLEKNQFDGPIPASIGNLIHLDELALSHNLLTGSLENCFAQLSRRVSLLYLDGNGFEGEISPSSLQEFTNLYHLFLNDNFLEGSLPCVSTMSRLRVLSLQNNKFSGCMDAVNWEHLAELAQLNLAQNSLSGRIPSSFGGLRRLEVVNLSSNLLEGPIPEEIGMLRNIESLNFSENRLSGRIPSALSNCTRLYKLNLSGNKLEGEIPSEIVKSLRNLQFLHLDRNCLVGPLPSGIRMLRRLKKLYLKGNRGMKGVCIPPEVVAKSSIWKLLRENGFI